MGLVSSIPIGPINLTIISTALNTSLKRSAAMALAVAVTDGIYAFIAASTVSLPHWSTPVLKYVGLAGALIVCGYGFYLILNEGGISTTVKAVQPEPYRDLSLGILTGVILYVSNPTFLFFWISAAGASRLWFPAAFSCNLCLFGAGVILGTATWFGFLLYLVRRSSTFILPISAKRLAVTAGWVLIAFGGFALVTSLKHIL